MIALCFLSLSSLWFTTGSIQLNATVIRIRPDFNNVNQILLQLAHHAAIDATLKAILRQQLWLPVQQLMMLQSFAVGR